MHKKKNQKPITNLVAQKQADTSQVKKPKPTQAQPTLLKEEDEIKLEILQHDCENLSTVLNQIIKKTLLKIKHSN
jgi:transposase